MKSLLSKLAPHQRRYRRKISDLLDQRPRKEDFKKGLFLAGLDEEHKEYDHHGWHPLFRWNGFQSIPVDADEDYILARACYTGGFSVETLIHFGRFFTTESIIGILSVEARKSHLLFFMRHDYHILQTFNGVNVLGMAARRDKAAWTRSRDSIPKEWSTKWFMVRGTRHSVRIKLIWWKNIFNFGVSEGHLVVDPHKELCDPLRFSYANPDSPEKLRLALKKN